MATSTSNVQDKAKNERPAFTKADEMVTFIIGPEDVAEKFVVHKEFACHYSSVLKAAFASKFIEGRTQTYRMTNVEPGTFRMFVQWLYTQKLRVDQLLPPRVKTTFGYVLEDEELAALWILAEKLLIPTLQNATIEAITDIGNRYDAPATDTFNFIYENTPDRDSPLRRLAVAQSIRFLESDDILDQEIFPMEFLRELAYALLEGGSRAGKVEAKDFFISTEKDGGNGNGN